MGWPSDSVRSQFPARHAVYLLAIAALTIFLLGIVTLLSSTSADLLDHGKQSGFYAAAAHQLIGSLLGFLLAFGLYRLGWKRFLSLTPILFWGVTFLLLLALIPSVGREVNGSRRWLSIASISVQPSEFMKYLAPAYCIAMLSRWKEGFSFALLFRLLATLLIPIVFILLEPNNGTAAVVILSLLVLAFLTQLPLRLWILPLCICAVIVTSAALQLGYVQRRLEAFLHPEEDLRGKGHQPYQAKVAAGSGGLLGKGVGRSWQKLSYLPEAQNDYIAAIYAEETGFLGMTLLILCYCLLVYSGFVIAFFCEEAESFQLSGTYTFLFGFQVFLNLGVVSGLLPTTGLNLPLFSQGGSSLIANICALGILLSAGLPAAESPPRRRKTFFLLD